MRLLLFNCLLLLFLPLYGQHYYVVSVKGDIYAADQMLAPKDRIDADTELRFVGREAQAYVMSPTKGYFVLGPQAEKHGDRSEFLLAVRQAILPASELKMTGIREISTSRAGIHLEDSYDLLDYFRGPIAYVDTLRIYPHVDYIAGKEARLRLRVCTPEDTAESYLSWHEDHFVLAIPDSLLGKSETITYTLSYPEEYDEDPTLEAEFFRLVPLSEALVKEEVAYMRSLLGEDERAQSLPLLAEAYLRTRYGKVNPHWLGELLEGF